MNTLATITTSRYYLWESSRNTTQLRRFYITPNKDACLIPRDSVKNLQKTMQQVISS